MTLEKTLKELSTSEKKVLVTLGKIKGDATPQAILKNGEFSSEVEVMNAASWLQSKKLVEIKDDIKTVYHLGSEGKEFLKDGLPEKNALIKISENAGSITLSELSKHIKKEDVPVAIGWMKRKQWVTIKKEKVRVFTITEEGKKALKTETDDEKILKKLNDTPDITLDKKTVQTLITRKNVIKEKELISSHLVLTENGKKILGYDIKITDEVSQITSSFIKSGEWKNKSIRPYDIDAFAPSIHGGKAHPLVGLIQEIREIFFKMGFEEIQGNYVESCFWNMDVLFIPQDHPAREMQDTLYCKNPSEIKISETKLVDEIKKVHEDGGNTSSTGWGYDFSKEEGKRPLLRTHTTVNTIRHLYNNPEPPCKVFSIGRVFRKENIDSTHLPEFYQIEGIIHEENATFRQLKGVLKEFYKGMGFEKIRFRPGYFPYTEPSMEVDVYWNDQWMELGGSGIFRPEVTEPVGVKNPVLAWGLGLERLAMLRYGLKDIRDLYISDLGWLQKRSLL